MRKPTLKATLKATLIWFILFHILVTFSCTKRPISKNECLQYFVIKELKSNPKFKQLGIEMFVRQVQNGYITIAIGANDKYFSDDTIAALRNGQSLRDIQTSSDKSVGVLIEAEEILKKMPDVKTVTWTADEQCPPGSACGSSSGQSMNSDQDYESGCAENKR